MDLNYTFFFFLFFFLPKCHAKCACRRIPQGRIYKRDSARVEDGVYYTDEVSQMEDLIEYKYCLGQCRKENLSLSMSMEEDLARASKGKGEKLSHKHSEWKSKYQARETKYFSFPKSSQEHITKTSCRVRKCRKPPGSGKGATAIPELDSGEDSLLVGSITTPSYHSGSNSDLEELFAMFQSSTEEPKEGRKGRILGCLNCICLKKDHFSEPVKIISSEDLYSMLDENSPPNIMCEQTSHFTNKD